MPTTDKRMPPDDAQGYGRMNRPPHLVLALCPVILGNNNAGSDSNSMNIPIIRLIRGVLDPTAARASLPMNCPTTNGIHRVVKLLEQIAYQ